MKKINDIIKDNYKIIIPIMLMLLLFVAFFVYYQVYIRDVFTDSNGSFYQYFYGKRYDYAGIVTTNRKDEVVDFKALDIEIEFDSTPIYYKNRNKVILPKDMSVVMPTLNSEYLSKGYSLISYNKSTYNLITKNYNKRLNHYFFYDSKDLYFFIENVVLKVNDREIKLSPFSYVIYSDRSNTLYYYDKENDKFETIMDINGEVVVSNDFYTIYVNKDSIKYYGGEVLLTSGIEHLNTIDMKD